jgi:hypothetical protein
MKGTTASALAVTGVALIGIAAALFARSGGERPGAGERTADVPASASVPPAAASSIVPPAARAAAPPPLVPSAEPPPADEASLMTRLRAAATSSPAQAVELARDGNRRFPDSADAPERTSILVHALAALDRPSEARGEAEDMVNHYPDSPWVQEVERFTGAHRHRNVILGSDGKLRFE